MNRYIYLLVLMVVLMASLISYPQTYMQQQFRLNNIAVQEPEIEVYINNKVLQVGLRGRYVDQNLSKINYVIKIENKGVLVHRYAVSKHNRTETLIVKVKYKFNYDNNTIIYLISKRGEEQGKQYIMRGRGYIVIVNKTTAIFKFMGYKKYLEENQIRKYNFTQTRDVVKLMGSLFGQYATMIINTFVNNTDYIVKDVETLYVVGKSGVVDSINIMFVGNAYSILREYSKCFRKIDREEKIVADYIREFIDRIVVPTYAIICVDNSTGVVDIMFPAIEWYDNVINDTSKFFMSKYNFTANIRVDIVVVSGELEDITKEFTNLECKSVEKYITECISNNTGNIN